MEISAYVNVCQIRMVHLAQALPPTGIRRLVAVNVTCHRTVQSYPTAALSIHSCLTGTLLPAPAFVTHLRTAETKALTSTNAHLKCQTGPKMNADVDAQLMKMELTHALPDHLCLIGTLVFAHAIASKPNILHVFNQNLTGIKTIANALATQH